jgi:redox-sensitive bicupin YhaK (pirin superfamily)
MKVLVYAGKPLRQPVAARGPFVMNTPQEIEQAYADYRAGLF